MATYRIGLLNLLMAFIACSVFMLSSAVAEEREWLWFGFEQSAAFGCLVSAVVPVIVYAKSKVLKDQILTIVQVVMLLTTALIGFGAPLFLERRIWLFFTWYAMAAIGVTVAVRLTLRMAFKNGQRLSHGEIEELQEELQKIRILEELFQEEIRTLNGRDQIRAESLQLMLERTRSDCEAREEYLSGHSSIRPPPIFGGDSHMH